MDGIHSLIIKLFFLLSPFFALAQSQQKQIDSMRVAMQHAANDTVRMDLYRDLGFFYDDVNIDSSVYYNEQGLAIARRLGLKLNEAEILMGMSFPLVKMGNYPRSLKVLMQASAIAEDPSNEKGARHLSKDQTVRSYRLTTLGYIHLGFGYLYANTGNYEKGLAIYPEGLRIAESIQDTLLLANMYGDMGLAYFNLNKLDSSLLVRQKALTYFAALPFEERKFEGDVFSGIGSIYLRMGKPALARENYEKAVQVSVRQNNPALAGEAYLSLARFYQSFKNADSCLFYAKKALASFTTVGKGKFQAVAYRMISDSYGEKNNTDSSFAYLRLATLLNDSLERIEKKKIQEFQLAGFDEQLRLQELEKEKIQTQAKITAYTMLAGIAVFMLIAFLLYRNNRNRRKANLILEEQKQELQSTLTELKLTQSQLIQSEKMASLGELTAGIAHEIQNPLNFVNNFSEVSSELLAEMNEELEKGDLEEVKAIANDIKDNLEKINHHGKRADSIVKGMLQHSQRSSAVKEPTNINALTEEYLRLAYHGLRAKDNAFNVTLKTDFDPGIGEAAIIPQDIGRVVLNLLNNAFYAVQQKQKELAGQGYEPTVAVSTKKTGNNLVICVEDNGNGIPVSIKEKIFQPFFTTKPTGQGTGLGLSLSYDIVTKGHGGELRVETTEGKGSTFIIQLPIT